MNDIVIDPELKSICSNCHGLKVIIKQILPTGNMAYIQERRLTCPMCNGTGFVTASVTLKDRDEDDELGKGKESEKVPLYKPTPKNGSKLQKPMVDLLNK